MAVLSLGTNLGDRAAHMQSMEALCAVALSGELQFSPLYETEPLAVGPEHLPYYNRIVAGFFEGSARELLIRVRVIERMLGRNDAEKGKYLPRVADIDILLFGGDEVQDPDLHIPHDAILDRRFCIEGIAAIVPDMVHPVCGKRFDVLRAEMGENVRSQGMQIVD